MLKCAALYCNTLSMQVCTSLLALYIDISNCAMRKNNIYVLLTQYMALIEREIVYISSSSGSELLIWLKNGNESIIIIIVD